MRNRFVASAGVVLVVALWLPAARAADRPRLPGGGGGAKSAPAGDKPSADQPTGDKPAPADPPTPDAAAPSPGDRAELAGGRIRYTVPPEGWVYAPASKTATRDAYVAEARDAMMSIEVMPAGTTYSPDMAAAMARKIKQLKPKGTKYVQEPTVEKDERFLVRIRERYEKADKVADQLHLYRQVGDRVVLVLCNSLAGEEGAEAHHKLAEQTLLSAENAAAPAASKPAAGKGKGK